LAAWNYGSLTLAGSTRQVVTFSHRMPVSRKPDNGGPFMVTKYENNWTPGFLNHGRYIGAYAVGNPNSGSYTSPSGFASTVSDHDLDVKGTVAIARCEPTSSAIDFSVTIGELRNEGLPGPLIQNFATSLKERTAYAKSAGGDYLNYQFGWVPLVSDLMKLHKIVEDQDRIWNSYLEGSKKKIRRRFHYPEETQTQQYAGSFLPTNSSQFPLFLNGTETWTKESKMWFSGAFRYYIPTSTIQTDRLDYYAREARKLYGITLTPEIVWNLQPWSWFGDWFLDTGDLLHNISAMGTDGLVMEYGYMMSEKKLRRVRVSQAPPGGTGSSHELLETKLQRRPANPYGFGVTFDSLSAKQTAILVALGLSKT